MAKSSSAEVVMAQNFVADLLLGCDAERPDAPSFAEITGNI
jgi:hypothetical protein